MSKRLADENECDLLAEIRDAIEDGHTTLRDRFAMAALTGMLPGSDLNVHAETATSERHLIGYVAKAAYLIADAMLKERKS